MKGVRAALILLVLLGILFACALLVVSRLRRRTPRGRHRARTDVPLWFRFRAHGRGGSRRRTTRATRSSRDRSGLPAPLALSESASPPEPSRLPVRSFAVPEDIEPWLSAADRGDAGPLWNGLRILAGSWPTRISPPSDLSRRLGQETETVEDRWRSGRLSAVEAASRLAAVVGEIDAYWWQRTALPPEAAPTVRRLVRDLTGTSNSPEPVADLVHGALGLREILRSYWVDHELRWNGRESATADLLRQVADWQRQHLDTGRISRGRSRASADALHSLVVQVDGFFSTRWAQARGDGVDLAARLDAFVGQDTHRGRR